MKTIQIWVLALSACIIAFVSGRAVERSSRSVRGNVISKHTPTKMPAPSTAPVFEAAPRPLLTKKETDDTERMLGLKRDGYYVLRSETPFTRKQDEHHANRGAEVSFAQREAEYDDIFSVIGLDEETIKKLKHHLLKIYKAKIETSQAESQLASATNAFDASIRKALGDKYAIYRREEDAFPARRELARMDEYARANGGSISPTERPVIERLLQQSKAFSLGTVSEWGGPYHKPPASVAGSELASFLQSQRNRVDEASRRLMEEGYGAGLSGQSIDIVKKYYEQELAALERQIEGATNRDIAAVRFYEKQLAVLRQHPNENPDRIRAVEKAWASSQKRLEAQKRQSAAKGP